VPEYWLVDLRAHVLEVFREPQPETGAFAVHEVLDDGQDVALPGLTVRFSVASLLP
jgi:Uma2 family endonuclease